MSEQDGFLHATMGSMDLVYNLARRAVPRPDVEDLVQETYLAAFRAWADHRRPRKVEPWLATICLNLVRSRYRTKQRRPGEVPLESLGEQASAQEGPPEAAIRSLDAKALHAAMEQLPEEQRIALTLVDLGGLSTQEAAEIMNTPRGTVLSRLHRGRRRLAEQLAPLRDTEGRES